MENIVIGWPEGIFLFLVVLGIVLHLALDGKPRTGTYSFGANLISSILLLALLYWGGFFDGRK